jgi:hypothetical protein
MAAVRADGKRPAARGAAGRAFTYLAEWAKIRWSYFFVERYD